MLIGVLQILQVVFYLARVSLLPAFCLIPFTPPVSSPHESAVFSTGILETGPQYTIIFFLSIKLTAVKVSNQHPSFLFFKSPVCPTNTTVYSITFFIQMLFHLQFGY